MRRTPADIQQVYGPFPDIDGVHGVSFDGRNIWFASNDGLHALDPGTGALAGAIAVPASAGTAFDGENLYQIAAGAIRKIDPASGAVLATIPAPAADDSAGLAWAEGALWVGLHKGRRIVEIDPETGEVLSEIESDRFVTGVAWVDGELWHGTWEDEQSEIRRIDPASSAVLDRLDMPPGTIVSGLESDGGDSLFCGGGATGVVRVVRRPKPG